MRGGRAATAVAAGALTAAGLSPAASGQGPPATPSLAVTIGSDVRLLNADGTGRRALFPPSSRRTGEPDWSPDGSQIAFVSSRESRGGRVTWSYLHVVNADGTGERRVTTETGSRSPTWAPNGRRLAFAAETRRGSAHRSSIVVVDVDGGGRFQLTSGGYDSQPAWSPDGARIAFTRLDLRGRAPARVWVVNADGSGARALADGSAPDWAPDGSRVAFASDRDRNGETCYHDCWPNNEIYVMAADGSGETRVTRDPGDDVNPAWSPDGAVIAFDSDRNYPSANRFEVYMARPDGSCVTRLTNSNAQTGGVDWRPGAAGVSAGPCGADGPGALTPAVDMDLTAAGRGSLYLGEAFRGMLLTDVGAGFFVYDDCTHRLPKDCFGQVQLQRWRVCARQPLMYGGGGDIPGVPPFVPRYTWRRGALLADYGGGAHTDVHTGPDTITVFGPGRSVGRAVAGALRPVHGERRPLLESPRFPASAMRRVREVGAAYARLGSVARVRRALRLSRERVLQSLALGRALRGHPVGPHVRC